jgi:hypothetical protein
MRRLLTALKQRIGREQAGQALVELLVAMGIASLMLPAMATAIVASREGRVQQHMRLEATALLRETNEAVRSVREKDWNQFALVGSFHTIHSGGVWSLAPGTQTIGQFTQRVVIAETQRNTTTGVIVTSGGTVDPSTIKATVTISWATPVFSYISNEAYFQRYSGNTSWSETATADFSDGTLTNTVASSTGGGQVELAAAGGPAHVQSRNTANSASSTTIAQTFNSAVTGGNLIVVAVSWDSSSTASVTCSDNVGNTYSSALVANDTINTQALGICYAANSVGGTAITVTATFAVASTTRYIAIHEYSGVAVTSPADGSSSGVAVGSTAPDNVTSGSATTTVSGDLIFGAVVETAAGSTTISPGTNFTQRQNVISEVATQDRIQASAGSVASTMTFGTSQRYAAAMMAFKPLGTPTDWSPPVSLSSYNAAGTQDALDVFSVGNYAYLCDGTVMTILDMTTPANPTFVGSYTASSTVNHVYVDGTYAYLSTINNSAELTIVNISNPASPALASTVNLADTNDALTTFVAGGFAYVGRAVDTTSGTNEFYIINVSNPNSPSTLGSINLTGNVNNIKVNGNFAYLATAVDTTEVVVINVTNKSAPTTAGSYNAAGTADGVDLGIQGTTLYLAEVNNTSGAEVFALSIATPSTPSLLGTYEVGGNVTGISPTANYLFLSTIVATRQFIVVNSSTPSSLTLRANVNLGVNANDIKFSGTYAYIATTSDTQEMRIFAPFPEGGSTGYQASGTYESSTFDTLDTSGFNYITFTISEPASTDITFQIATNNDNATWSFVGPDGTAGTSFSSPGTIHIATTGRYVRYRATLTGPGSSTPVLSDIGINYSP